MIYNIEFQKRGLPHAHIVLFLDWDDKISNATDIDKFISTELPNMDKDPLLYVLVINLIIYEPYGSSNSKSHVKGNKCLKIYPKRFNKETYVDGEVIHVIRDWTVGKQLLKLRCMDNKNVVL